MTDLLVVKNDELNSNDKRLFVVDKLPVKISYESSYTFKTRGLLGLKMRYAFFNGNRYCFKLIRNQPVFIRSRPSPLHFSWYGGEVGTDVNRLIRNIHPRE